MAVNKPVFENEEEFKSFIKEIGYYPSSEGIKRAQSLGYIKKSIVEKAEDAYRKYYVTENGILGQEVIEVQHKAIQHLKQKLSEAGK